MRFPTAAGILILSTLNASVLAASAVTGDRSAAQRDEAKAAPTPAAAKAPKQQLLSGQVVMLKEALKRRGIASGDEFGKQIVLETDQGELVPIVPDWRGRAFFQDERLRNRKVQLVGRRKPGVPWTAHSRGDFGHERFCCQIPNTHGPLLSCGEQQLAVRRKPHKSHGRTVLDRLTRSVMFQWIPNTPHAIRGAGDQVIADLAKRSTF